MRKLPHLDSKDSADVKKQYSDWMDLYDNEIFMQKFPAYLELFFEKSDTQINEIMEKLTGLGVPSGSLLDEDQTYILEPDTPMRTASERAPWNWVPHTWDRDDLEIWERLTEPEFDKDKEEYRWEAPVPSKSIPDLLYNSKRIVDGLPNPRKWEDYGNQTGLVLGSVQSGKTASMLGVTSIAMDDQVGYKIIIVLAGHTENLRAQTLNRFEVFQKILGNNVSFPVKGDQDLKNVELPKRAKDRRMHINLAKTYLEDSERPYPIVYVVKKNTSVLKGLISIMEGLHEGGAKFPTLILDDESDHSSLDTKRNKAKPSAIHDLICKLRDSIVQNAYLGYTATPQAILLQSLTSELFPKDFLWLLEPHEKYFGPNEFFNEYSSHVICRIPSSEFPNYGDEEVEEILKETDGPSLVELQKETIRSWKENGPTDSMRRALIDFVLTGGVRWFREGIGDDPEYPDHSMIFHIDRTTSAHKIVGDVVEMAWKETSSGFLDLLDRSFELDQSRDFDSLVSERWERISTNIEAIRLDPKDRPQIKRLAPFVRMIIETIGGEGHSDHIRNGLRIINSMEGNELPYHLEEGEGRPPKALIVIGGDLLSRGVTIEGLCVSYYVRLARTPSADTELQRCRWFGAKWDFRELATLYMQEQHQVLFKDIADHNQDLSWQVKEAIVRGFKPDEVIFLLQTRDSYQTTGYSKRGRTVRMNDSYTGNWTQFKQPSIKYAKQNLDDLHDYLSALKKSKTQIYGKRGKLWEGVDPRPLLLLLNSLKVDVEGPSQIRPKELAAYLERWMEEGSLPAINIVQRWGKGDSPVSEKRREMDGADGSFFVRDSFTNLAAGAAGNFSGDWFIDAVKQRKGASDMDREKFESWFEENPDSKDGRWQRTRRRRRKEGAPILIVFYQLDPTYVNRKYKDSRVGKGPWRLDPEKEKHLITEDEVPLVGFIASLPWGGPPGGGIANPELLQRIGEKGIKMIAGREIDSEGGF